jgi:hypothetical protein
MRVIHGSKVPYYAILPIHGKRRRRPSQKMQDGKGKDKAGYTKIAGCYAGLAMMAGTMCGLIPVASRNVKAV